MAELAAVAHVCSALSSDRPQRAAIPPEEVLATLRTMAGHHLNSEAVDTFVSMVEVYPVGVHVRFGSGKYRGCYGVVVACRVDGAETAAGAAAVRCRGHAIPDGVDVDLRHLPDDADLTAVPEAGVSVE